MSRSRGIAWNIASRTALKPSDVLEQSSRSIGPMAAARSSLEMEPTKSASREAVLWRRSVDPLIGQHLSYDVNNVGGHSHAVNLRIAEPF